MEGASIVRAGALAGWINGICYVIGAVLFSLVGFGITGAPEPEFGDEPLENIVAFFSKQIADWPQNLAISAIFLVGFLALIPLAMALKRVIADPTGKAHLGYVAVSVAALMGAMGQLISIGVNKVVIDYADDKIESQQEALLIVNDVVNEVPVWFGIAFLLLAGMGIWLLGSAGSTAAVPSGWVRLAKLVGMLYILAFIFQTLAQFLPRESGVGFLSSDIATTIYQVIVLVGGAILAPVWAVWSANRVSAAGAEPSG